MVKQFVRRTKELRGERREEIFGNFIAVAAGGFQAGVIEKSNMPAVMSY
jgi:hypothetical protein